jgi:hypothetical protein
MREYTQEEIEEAKKRWAKIPELQVLADRINARLKQMHERNTNCARRRDLNDRLKIKTKNS